MLFWCECTLCLYLAVHYISCTYHSYRSNTLIYLLKYPLPLIHHNTKQRPKTAVPLSFLFSLFRDRALSSSWGCPILERRLDVVCWSKNMSTYIRTICINVYMLYFTDIGLLCVCVSVGVCVCVHVYSKFCHHTLEVPCLVFFLYPWSVSFSISIVHQAHKSSESLLGNAFSKSLDKQ